MSARSERLFAHELRRLGDKLTIPIPDRTRILRELSGDLEALTEQLVAAGTPHDEAYRRATEALVPDDATLRALERLHEPLYVRLTRRVDPARLRAFERLGLVGATAFMVAASALVLIRAEMVSEISTFQWPVMGVGVLLFAGVLAKTFEIWIKKDHSNVRRGLTGLLALSFGPVALAALGFLLATYQAAAIVEVAPERLVEVLGTWLFTNAVLLATGLVTTLSGMLAWYALTHWTASIENDHRKVLGLTGPASSKLGD